MLRRFYSETALGDEPVVLEGAEAHHLIHVLRAGPGTQVVLFDGSGDEFEARVTRLERQQVYLQVERRISANRELRCPLTVAAALPKGDRQRFLVEKLVELGATSFVPLITQRGGTKFTTNVTIRLRRAVVEASKQCKRNRLMHVGEGQTFTDYVACAPAAAVRWLAHLDGKNIRDATDESCRVASCGETGVYIAVGPEGGFSDEEIGLAIDAGWTAVSLGPRTLRVETAAIVLAAHWTLA